MASLPVREPVADHLLKPKNSALVVIDYQPSQFASEPVDGSRPATRQHWAREETVADVIEIVLTDRLLKA
jgi:hypothetical protein